MRLLVGIVMAGLCSGCAQERGGSKPEETGSTGMDATQDDGSTTEAEAGSGSGSDDDGPDSDGTTTGPDAASSGESDGSSSSGEPVAPWHRIEIELTDRPQGENLADVPVLVRLTPDRVDYDLIADEGADLRFVDEDGLRLRHEIEAWNPGGDSIVWVNLPSLSGYLDTHFTLEYGRPPPDAALPYAWNAYSSVWHLQGDPTDPDAVSPDSAGDHDLFFYASADGIDPIDGILDQGFALRRGADADDDNDTLRTWSSYSALHFQEEFTLEAWVRPGELSGGVIAGQYVSISIEIGLGGVARAGLRPYGHSSWDYATAPDPLPVDQWSYVVATLTADPSVLHLYVDGEHVDSYSYGFEAHTNHGGNVFRVDGEVDAEVDEVRLSLSGHTSEWVRLQHLSMTDDLLSFGPIEPMDADAP